MEEACDCVNQYSVGGSGLEPAGLFEGQDPFDPAVALGTRRPGRSFAPEHPTAQSPFCPVVRRLHTVVGQKYPQRVHLPQQATREPARVILSVILLVNQLTQPSIPGPPGPGRCG
jgi:hypothetical protein